jgi:hypothetical protein
MFTDWESSLADPMMAPFVHSYAMGTVETQPVVGSGVPSSYGSARPSGAAPLILLGGLVLAIGAFTVWTRGHQK